MRMERIDVHVLLNPDGSYAGGVFRDKNILWQAVESGAGEVRGRKTTKEELTKEGFRLARGILIWVAHDRIDDKTEEEKETRKDERCDECTVTVDTDLEAADAPPSSDASVKGLLLDGDSSETFYTLEEGGPRR